MDQVTNELSSIPFAPRLGADAKRDLVRHGVDYGLGGLFTYIGEEEKAIREDPAKRTSQILRRRFRVCVTGKVRVQGELTPPALRHLSLAGAKPWPEDPARHGSSPAPRKYI